MHSAQKVCLECSPLLIESDRRVACSASTCGEEKSPFCLTELVAEAFKTSYIAVGENTYDLFISLWTTLCMIIHIKFNVF